MKSTPMKDKRQSNNDLNNDSSPSARKHDQNDDSSKRNRGQMNKQTQQKYHKQKLQPHQPKSMTSHRKRSSSQQLRGIGDVFHDNNIHSTSQHRFGRVMDTVPCRNRPRFSTISIALPGSVVSNCQTRELKTYICGQIARAATIYHIDEIIIYNDHLTTNHTSTTGGYQFFNNKKSRTTKDNSNSIDDNPPTDQPHDDLDNHDDKKKSSNHHHDNNDPHTFMANILQYCECPQYLRRHFFPMHYDFQFVGLLPPIDAPHHVRVHDICQYREGVVLEEKYVSDKQNVGKLVNCGIRGRPVL
jgi:predicted SPOUT superfamily RNA methylase MTH1